MNRIVPDIPKIRAHWTRRTSDIPDYLMVPMSDQRKVKYVPEIIQPRPFFRDKLNKFSNLCIGYKRAGDAATSTGRKD